MLEAFLHSLTIIMWLHTCTQIRAPTLLYTDTPVNVVLEEINFSDQNLNMSSLIVK